MTGHLVVETDCLSQVYTLRGRRGRATSVVALNGVTLSVRRGEVFGLLGVNGAGKSTLLRILATQLRPSSGTARIGGFDVCRYARQARRHIGVVCGGDALLAGVLTLHDRLWMRARVNGAGAADATHSVHEVLDAAGMSDCRDMRTSQLSSGLRQRAHLARGLVTGPKVLLLDQPTLGLDCAASRDVRGFIRRWRDADAMRTVVLATNDMREANDLCDRVAILDAGRVLACETPAALKEQWHPQAAESEPRASGAAALEHAFLSIVGRSAWARA